MKAINSATKQKSLMALLILLVSLTKVNYTKPNPDCVSGIVGYTIFNDSVVPAFQHLDSMELRSVNLLTGAVGSFDRWNVTGSGNMMDQDLRRTIITIYMVHPLLRLTLQPTGFM